MPAKKKFTVNKIIKALKACDGYITHAADLLGCDYHTVSIYIKDNPKIEQALEEIDERSLDFTESKLKERIGGVAVRKFDNKGKEIIYDIPPDVQSIKYHLNCKGKKRGYVEKTEVEHIIPEIKVRYVK